MKGIIALVIFLFTSKITIAQNTQTCFIKYKEYKTDFGTLNHWFTQEKQTLTGETNYKKMYMKRFLVLINNVMTTQSDTIKYNKEFNEFVLESIEQEKKRPIDIWMKDYKTGVESWNYYDDFKNKHYIVEDTMKEMEKWEIYNDTQTILGFKCQKATIYYKNNLYIAWFTTEIPFNGGPDYFRGLPGLILKVQSLNGKLGYEAIEIQLPSKEKAPVYIKKSEIITKKVFREMNDSRNKKMIESRDNMINGTKQKKE